MDTGTKQVISLFIDNYNTLKKPLYWKAGKIYIKLCALTCALGNVWVQSERFIECIGYIKKHTRWYSPLRSSRILAAAFLEASGGKFEASFAQYSKCYRALKKAGFKGNKYLPFAAMELFALSPEGYELAKSLKAYALYRKMKKIRPYLPPLELLMSSVMMASSGRSIGDAFKDSENIIYRLIEHNFSQTSGLQLLVGILTYDIHTPERKAQLGTDISSFLSKINLKVPSLFYGTISLLALSGDNWSEAIKDTLDTVGLLKLSKCFSSFEKEYSIIFASAMVTSGLLRSRNEKSANFLRLGSDITYQAVIGAQIIACLATAAESGAARASNQKSDSPYKCLKEENTSGTMILKH